MSFKGPFYHELVVLKLCGLCPKLDFSGKCLQILVEHAKEEGAGSATDETKQPVTQKFREMSEEDNSALRFDGKFTRPEWLISTVLPVSPLVERDGP